VTTWYASWLPWIVGIAALHWLVPARLRVAYLTVAGAAFLAATGWPSCVLLLAASVGVYLSHGRARASLAAGVALGAAFLAVRGGGPAPLPELAFLGAAYYLMRAWHYLLEGWLGRLPAHGFLDVLAYMFFPPILPLGPIERFEDLNRELRRLHWDPERFAEGLERLLYGYAKVVVVADYLLDSWLHDASDVLVAAHPGAFAYVDCLRIGLSLYFRFAGYSDIAIGFALLLGVRVRENFAAPFLATNISAFWRRWHMSLTSWSRDYVYLPIAATTRSPVAASLGAMLVVGAWHGLTWRYLAWGLYHGVGIAGWQLFQRVRPTSFGRFEPAWRLAAWFLTFQFVIFGFLITTAPDLPRALSTFKLIFGIEEHP
jgi:D-alanyl-lipoteichoic acid acyltransferase DltB (MBOAT superfamily)